MAHMYHSLSCLLLFSYPIQHVFTPFIMAQNLSYFRTQLKNHLDSCCHIQHLTYVASLLCALLSPFRKPVKISNGGRVKFSFQPQVKIAFLPMGSKWHGGLEH